VVLVVAAAAAVSAQTSRGTVTGIVSDQNGSVISGAEAELKNSATNQVRTTKTNDSGLYRFDAVDLAVYDLTIKAKGFKTITNTAILVQANRIATIDAKMEVGTSQEVVEVSAAAGELLQTSDAVRGGNFTASQIQTLPGGTNAYDLGRLLPGVVTATAGAQFGNDSQFSVNGQRPRGNNYLIDGTENNDISVTGPATEINNPDAVAEVSIQTGLFSAEFGRAGGGVFNLVTKSGTNGVHGTGRWLFASQAFNALTNSNRLAGLTKPPVFTRNIWSGTIGGPLPLPRFGEGGPGVKSGRDRTFFFFSIQWDRNRSTANFGGSSGFLVPTDLGVQQLRALFPAGTNPRLDLYLQAIGNTRGVTSLSTIDLGANRGTFQVGRTGVSFPRKINDTQWVFRLDHKLSQKHQLAFRYTDDKSFTTPSAIIVSRGFRREFTGEDKNLLVTDTWMATPSLTNEFRFSYGKIDFNFPISTDADPLAFTMPQISFGSGSGALSTIGTATNIPQFRIANNYQFQYTGTKTHNAHTFRFGLEFLKQIAQQHPPFNERGSFGFQSGGGFTPFANFLDNFSGASGTANINFGDPIYHPNLFRHSYFIQDTWKKTKNLTLTLGLRYENFGQPANSAFKFPAFAGFDPAAFTVPNKVNPDNNNFGPVVGFAYSPSFQSGPFGRLFGDGKSVIRGGYQVSYDTYFNNLLSNIAADSPNTLSATTTGSSGRGNAAFFPGAVPATAPAVTPLLSQTSVFNPNIRNPYTQRWSFGVQRELPLKLLMDISYVGSGGRKLFVSEDLNPVANPSASPVVRLFPALGVRRWRTSGANSNYHSAQFRVDKRLSRGLQFIASYTWSKLMDQISEVFATDQTLSSLASVPAFLGGLKLDYAPSDYDRRHRFVFSYVWNLPGPRTGFAAQALGGWQISGITVFQSGAPFTIANGLDRNGDGQTGPDRPDIGNPNAPHNTRAVVATSATDPCRAAVSTGLRNPDTGQCVTRNDVYVVQVAAPTGTSMVTPGPATLGRNTEHSNPIKNFDMSFFKMFRVRENLKLEYRLDVTNIFNHPQFSGIPAADVTNSSAGSFLNYNQINGGGRTMQMGLRIIF